MIIGIVAAIVYTGASKLLLKWAQLLHAAALRHAMPCCAALRPFEQPGHAGVRAAAASKMYIQPLVLLSTLPLSPNKSIGYQLPPALQVED